MCQYAHAQKLPFTNYTSVNGLVHNRTHTICQDGKGYIWIGTDHGICRYDGRNFKHFTRQKKPFLSSRYTTRYKDSVYFSIDGFGLAVCYGDSVRFIEITGVPAHSVDGMVCLNDGSYAANVPPYGLFHVLPNGHAKKVPLSVPADVEKNFVDIYQDSKGNIWDNSAFGLVLFPKGDLSHPVMPDFVNKSFINVVRDDKYGNIYVSCKATVFKYTPEQVEHIEHAIPEKLNIDYDVTAIEAHDDGCLWLGGYYHGLARFDFATKKYIEYGTKNGLTSTNVWGLLKDKEQNLWIATENGVSKLPSTNFVTYDFSNTAFQSVKSCSIWNDSTILFSNLVDIYSYSKGNVARLSGYKNDPAYTEDLMLPTPDNKLIVTFNEATPSGVFYVYTCMFDVKNNQLLNRIPTNKMPGGPVSIFISQNYVRYGDELLINGSNGIQVYKNGRFYKCFRPKLNNEVLQITAMRKDNRGDIWMIHNYTSLVRYSFVHSDNDSFYGRIVEKEQIPADKLGNQHISDLFVDSKNNIWLCGREYGLVMLRTDKTGKVTAINNHIAKYLSSMQISDIAEDAKQTIWIGTSMGLDKLTPSKDSFIVERDIHGSDLCGKYIYFIRPIQDKIFVGTTGCMAVINIDNEEDTSAPLIYITGFKVNEHNRNSLLLTNAPQLRTNENNISFTFTGLSYKDERKIKYSYLLEGSDNSWSQPQAEYTINYSQLRPGKYTFKVKAISARGIWSKDAAVYTFIIIQPFYTQWWFITLVVIIIAAIVYGIYKYRINQLLAIQNIRQNISKDLHDDIGATISSINILANMAKSNMISEDKRNRFLETIQDDSKHVSESLSDIVWSINPKNDSLEIMFARMQRYASELLEAKNINYNITLPATSLEDMTMGMHKRQQVYLIFKEAINNLVKYAEATKAIINLNVERNIYTMYIADNGIGFDMTKNYAGNGIINMKKRAADTGGTLLINSKLHKGTEITFSMSF